MKTMYCRVCAEEVEVEGIEDETKIHKECGSNLTKIGYVKEVYATIGVGEMFQGKLPDQWKPIKVELIKENGQVGVKITFRIDWGQN